MKKNLKEINLWDFFYLIMQKDSIPFLQSRGN